MPRFFRGAFTQVYPTPQLKSDKQLLFVLEVAEEDEGRAEGPVGEVVEDDSEGCLYPEDRVPPPSAYPIEDAAWISASATCCCSY